MKARQPANGAPGQPYLRVELTIAVAVVTAEGAVLNDDFVDVTLAFGRPVADGPAIAAGVVTSERLQPVLAQQGSDLATALRVFMGQNFAYVGELEDRGMLEDIAETGPTIEAEGRAVVRLHDLSEPVGGAH